MDLLICIDDTDNADSRGTGALADELRDLVTERFSGNCGYVTRHQLLIHSDIPYTSHNSSMCFPCNVDTVELGELAEACYGYLADESAPESDPGIAVADVQKSDKALLESFGMDAKRRVITKEEAHDTAKRAGVWLREAGGTGQGIIGALAGAGLRLWGNDGDLRGKLATLEKGAVYSVREIKDSNYIQEVRDEKGSILPDDENVFIKWKAKPSLRDGRFTLYVKRQGDGWSTMEKDEMRRFLGEHIYSKGCGRYVPDVEEEQVDDTLSCYNCRYRRWTGNGFMCQRERER